MGHNDQCDLFLSQSLFKEFHNLNGNVLILGAGRFIRQDQSRFADQSPRDGDSLLLAAGLYADFLVADLLGGRKIGLSMSTMMPQSFQGMIASMESRKASRFVDGDDWHIQFH